MRVKPPSLRVCNEVVERHQLVRGYEIEKRRYVQVTDDELAALEAEANSNIEVKGIYSDQKSRSGLFREHLLSRARRGRRKSLSPARRCDGKERACGSGRNDLATRKLSCVRTKDGLVLQMMYYGKEIRDFGQIAKGENLRLTSEEIELGRGLIEKLSSKNFEPEAYEDERRNRVMAMIEEKVKGQETTVAPDSPAPRVVIDLMAALKESMRTARRGKKRTEERKRKKA
jgi:DNA end-binding protein Ku